MVFLLEVFFDGGMRPFLCVGARMSFHALVIDMALAKGAGIPAPSDAINWRGWGFQLLRMI